MILLRRSNARLLHINICTAVPSAFKVSLKESVVRRPFLPSFSGSMVAVYSVISPVGWISTANLEDNWF